MKQVIRVVPPPPGADGVTRAQGTQILGADGQPIEGVTRVELSAEPGDCWRAVIYCVVQADEMIGLAADVVQPIEVTTLDSKTREWMPI
ncbi:hypothetical protein [Lysobacter capsici]|uniref:hypothetical protein n=1 Tax=Lysobacter capsici TaxID=435897 RepID=UPI000716452C|nr:hypothetical protein [Lysobacter capsici]